MKNKGIGTGGVAQIVLIILKCFNLISWSWAAVLIPFWLMIGMTLIYVIGFIIYGFLE